MQENKFRFPAYITANDIRPETDEVLDKKVRALLGAMTREEKMNLCHGGTNPKNLGQIANAGYLPGVPRLGVPEIRMYDGPAGVTSVYETTGLPVQEMLASAWDPGLAYDYGKVEGSENFSISGNTQLGSQYDIVRTPHFSRNKDMLGEDPFLTTSLAVAETKGIQDQHCVATLKHFFAAVIGPDMQSAASQEIDEQTLHELYFPPFEAAAKEGRAGSFMCSYNRINGDYASASEYGQKTVLRDMWNYKGYMMSDWGANHALTIGKGMDMEMPNGAYNSNERLELGITKGRITWDDVETAAYHVLYGIGMVGFLSLVQLDENGQPLEEAGRIDPIRMRDTYEIDVKNGLLNENADICRRIAERGAVLLKNNGALPLRPEDYTGDNSVAMLGLGAVHLLSGAGQERSYGRISRMVSPYDSLKELAGKDANIVGCVVEDIVGEPVPAEFLYQDAAAEKPGVLRSWGIAPECDDAPKTPFEIGGAGQELKGIAASEDPEDADVPFSFGFPFTPFAVDVPGHETKSLCTIDPQINFTCGTIDGRVNQTYKNSSDGTAFSMGQAYTWTGYLKAPESGEYTLILEAIGGRTNCSIALDGEHYIPLGSTSLREGAQWPWGNLICTPEGMEIVAATAVLEAGKTYPIRLCGNAVLKEKDLQIRFAWVRPSKKKENREAAMTAASKAKKVVYFLSDAYTPAPLGVPVSMFDMGAMPDLEVPQAQQELLRELRRVMAPGSELIVLHNYGQLYALGSIEPICDGIMNVWTPGQEGGRAIAKLLLGQINPSGKMPVTIPEKGTDTLISDTPERPSRRYLGYVNQDGKKVVDFDEGIFTGYRWYDKENVKPLYAFGHGLSYTTFAYRELSLAQEGERIAVSFLVENTGDVMGTEIAQVYLGAAQVPDGVQMAKKQLCGFARIEALMPGEARRITVAIPARSFCYWNAAQELVERPDGTKDKWVCAGGVRDIWVGPASDRLLLHTTVTV